MKKTYLIFIAMVIGGLYSSLNAQTYNANTEKTSVLWKGKKVGGSHEGTINLKSGELIMDNNRPAGGSVIIDMTTLKDTDIDNDGMRERLENHLRSDDFFSVDSYPEARFEITGSEALDGGSFKIMGMLTIKGITEPLEFISKLDSSGDSLIFSGKIEIDRTLFNVRYGSKKFFANIADSAIDDIFTLDYELYLEKME